MKRESSGFGAGWTAAAVVAGFGPKAAHSITVHSTQSVVALSARRAGSGIVRTRFGSLRIWCSSLVREGILPVSVTLSEFAKNLNVETAFTVLAVAKPLKAKGKDVVELEIGDSPFDSTASAKAAGDQAIQDNQSHYCPSPGLPAFREAAAEFVREEFGIPGRARSNVVAGPGAKVFEQFFCEAFLNPGDGVLVFSPHFPTYLPNIERAAARAVLAPLQPGERVPARRRPTSSGSSPTIRRRKAIFLNSPHNPTGGVATEDDLQAHRRPRPRQERRGLQRRAVLPHGLEGHAIARCSSQPGMLDAVRRRLHVQQVVQHERLAARLRRVAPRRSPTRSAR